MRFEQEIRETLIKNAIHLIAKGGFEMATTKAITYSGEQLSHIKMNEVYIYRLFGSKEHLYETAFAMLDTELFYVVCDAMKEAGDIKTDTTAKLRDVFAKVWRFVLNNEERCRCYVRYYFSVYLLDSSLEAHNQLFAIVVNAFKPLFKEEADVKSIMHIVLTTLLNFAIRVYNGDLEDEDINTPHIFNVLYCMMASYFKDELKTDTNMLPCT